MAGKLITRRRALVSIASGLIGSQTFAAANLRTPAQTEGPFYPRSLPPETDNNLLDLAGKQAAGQIINLTGTIMDSNGKPIPNAVVEIWQANHWGRYSHPGDRSDRKRDPNFQGYGTFLSSTAGQYSFRTIKPGSYGGTFFRRTPHIHFKLHGPDFDPLTTQMYFSNEKLNAQDSILQSVRNPELRSGLITNFDKAKNDELTGVFNIVLG